MDEWRELPPQSNTAPIVFLAPNPERVTDLSAETKKLVLAYATGTYQDVLKKRRYCVSRFPRSHPEALLVLYRSRGCTVFRSFATARSAASSSSTETSSSSAS